MTIQVKNKPAQVKRVLGVATRRAGASELAGNAAGKAVILPKISAEEMDRRREMVRQADASNRLEGQIRDPASDPIFETYIRGDIEVTDMVPLFKAQLARR
jgi:Antitoxin VbhA